MDAGNVNDDLAVKDSGTVNGYLTNKLRGGALVTLLTSALTCLTLYLSPQLVEEIEDRSWDWRVQLTAKKENADQRIKVIVVDQPTLDFFEREYSLTWPFPRNAYARIISFLTASEAKGVAFDLLFTESSAQAVENDAELADSTAGSLPVVSAVALESYEKYVSPEKVELLAASAPSKETLAAWDQLYGVASSRRYPAATLPIPEILQKVTQKGGAALGTVQAEPDSDGVFRRYHAAARYLDRYLLSLPFALYDQTVTDKHSIVRYIDQNNQLVVKAHGGRGAYQTISFAEVMQAEADRAEGKTPRLSLETFRDSWVFLGVTAPGLLDLRPTSLNGKANGVEFVAAVFDNLLNQDFIVKLEKSYSYLLAVFFITLTVTAALWGKATDHAISFAAISLTFFSLLYLSAFYGYWVPAVAPFGGILTAAFLGLALQYQLEGKQLRFLRHAFQHYVSPRLVEQIVENPDQLSLGGEKRELSIFFSDIAGFTGLSERLQPAALVELLNDYLTLVTEIIQANSGTVDKFVGDAVVAFWNAPVNVPNHAEKALQTAILVQQALGARAEYYRERFDAELKTRIGLHTDSVAVGNFGSKSRFNYTVLGDGANLASRLEGANKKFGTVLMVSDSLVSRLPNRDAVTLRRLGAVRVVGREAAVDVYEPQISVDQCEFSPAALAQFAEALKLFELQQLAAATEIFAKLSSDPVALAYLARIRKEEELLKDTAYTFSPLWNLKEK